tara:strand:+ start:454 stop:1095 length:642 start_codon:yes stop_codon:yes gene_type:complete
MIHYVIPARKGSKGLPFKNRKLFDITASIIPKEIAPSVIVSTDDEYISNKANEYGFKVHIRSEAVSVDTANTRDLLKEVANDFNIRSQDDIIMLYLTYPERTFESIQNIYNFYKDNKGNSLLCKHSLDYHPYMCYYTLPDNKGMRVVNHDLYRRQDYPECFFVSYFLCILKAEYLEVVNKNLYHPQTIFYDLDFNSLDIDTEDDLKNFLEKSV